MRRSPSAKQLAALARGRAVLAKRRRQSGGAASPATLERLRRGRAALAASNVAPWSKSPRFCGFRKSTRRCFGRQSGKRSSPKCSKKRTRKGNCKKNASARRNHPSRRPSHASAATAAHARSFRK